MPHVKLTRSKHEKLVRTLRGAQRHMNMPDGETAQKAGFGCRQTYVNRLANPEQLTIQELEALGRVLHIPIDEIRAGIVY